MPPQYTTVSLVIARHVPILVQKYGNLSTLCFVSRSAVPSFLIRFIHLISIHSNYSKWSLHFKISHHRTIVYNACMCVYTVPLDLFLILLQHHSAMFILLALSMMMMMILLPSFAFLLLLPCLLVPIATDFSRICKQKVVYKTATAKVKKYR